jgi:predicted dehydrogenase
VLGGGVLLELSHELDYIRWFLGPIASVFCDAGSSGTLEIDVEDRVDAVLRTIDGCVVNLHMDFLQRVPSRVCKLVTENGTLMWNIYENSVHWLKASGGMDVLYEDTNYDRNTAYLNELDQLCKVARNECKPFISVSDGIETVALVEKLRISSNSGTVVKL